MPIIVRKLVHCKFFKREHRLALLWIYFFSFYLVCHLFKYSQKSLKNFNRFQISNFVHIIWEIISYFYNYHYYYYFFFCTMHLKISHLTELYALFQIWASKETFLEVSFWLLPKPYVLIIRMIRNTNILHMNENYIPDVTGIKEMKKMIHWASVWPDTFEARSWRLYWLW